MVNNKTHIKAVKYWRLFCLIVSSGGEKGFGDFLFLCAFLFIQKHDFHLLP